MDGHFLLKCLSSFEDQTRQPPSVHLSHHAALWELGCDQITGVSGRVPRTASHSPAAVLFSRLVLPRRRRAQACGAVAGTRLRVVPLRQTRVRGINSIIHGKRERRCVHVLWWLVCNCAGCFHDAELRLFDNG